MLEERRAKIQNQDNKETTSNKTIIEHALEHALDHAKEIVRPEDTTSKKTSR